MLGGVSIESGDGDDQRPSTDIRVLVLLLSAAYYAYRLLDGQVLTTLPGESELLP